MEQPASDKITTRQRLLAEFPRRPALWLGTGLGLGLWPWGPGTAGSIWGPAYVAGLVSSVSSGGWYWLVAAAVFVAGAWVCERCVAILEQKDPGSVVIDEIAAFPVVYALAGWAWAWPRVVAGYVLFRVFDIAKPWPVKRFERLPGGWGVMADDVVAAVYAGVVLWGMERLGWV